MNQYRGEPAVNFKGLTAMLATLVIWVGFLLSMRAENQSPLTTADLGLMRFALPAIVFLPWLFKCWPKVRRMELRYSLMIMLGGLPFFYLVSVGTSYAPAAHAGALVPGSAPLFVTGLAVLVFGEPLPKRRLLGLGTILLGIILLLGDALINFETGYWRGHLAFLGATLLWALYTVGLRVAGLNPMEATALLCTSAALILGGLLGAGAVESTISQTSWAELWPFLLTQGIGAGIVGGVTYGIAISNLGAEKTAALGSFTPALAAIAAIPVLGENLSLSTLCGVLIIMVGVLLASGIKFKSQNEQVTNGDKATV
ncbi:DMT family transporter [Pontibacterium sp.]|uniref:DMT family transporter n=1 Tax=Pontibacterium sp. TaxID=2036026 RepID=UPI0035182BE3